MFPRHLFFKLFLFVLMKLIASIITFSKKKKKLEKNFTLDRRLGTLALDMEPSTLDPRQKDRLILFHSHSLYDLPGMTAPFILP